MFNLECKTMTYLDWAATAKPREEIINNALKKSFNLFGNPSSPHNAGNLAKEELERCRTECAEILGTKSEKIYFTSGGSESNNIVIFSFLKKHLTGEILQTSIDHPSISEPLVAMEKLGWKIKKIDPTTEGYVNLKKLENSINESTKIISIIHVHNETGIIQPLAQIIKIVREKEKIFNKKIHLHVDGVQAAGKVDLNLSLWDVDSYSIAAHKFGGPRGVGLLYLKDSKEVLIRGGGQEKGIRPGTENLFGIIAMTECFKESVKTLEDRKQRLTTYMNKIITGISETGISTIPKNRFNNTENFVPNIVALTAPPIGGEVLVRVLNNKGFCISTGSACSNNKKSNTKGILSMGTTEKEGFSSFRVSMGYATTENDITDFIKALKETVLELKS